MKPPDVLRRAAARAAAAYTERCIRADLQLQAVKATAAEQREAKTLGLERLELYCDWRATGAPHGASLEAAQFGVPPSVGLLRMVAQ